VPAPLNIALLSGGALSRCCPGCSGRVSSQVVVCLHSSVSRTQDCPLLIAHQHSRTAMPDTPTHADTRLAALQVAEKGDLVGGHCVCHFHFHFRPYTHTDTQKHTDVRNTCMHIIHTYAWVLHNVVWMRVLRLIVNILRPCFAAWSLALVVSPPTSPLPYPTIPDKLCNFPAWKLISLYTFPLL